MIAFDMQPVAGDEMDEFHCTILEGYWWGLNACEIAHDMGADPVIVARIIDDFETLGY
jgi:hypothetical protein